MKPSAKIGVVVAGYLVAFLIAAAVVALNEAFMDPADASASGGMVAFGESLLFLAAFGVAAIPATCAGLFFLRTFRTFWTVLAALALVVAATSLAALACYVAGHAAERGSVLQDWAAFAVLRILIAPLFSLAFFLSSYFAPNRPARIALVVAAAVEAVVFGCVALMWFLSFRSH